MLTRTGYLLGFEVDITPVIERYVRAPTLGTTLNSLASRVQMLRIANHSTASKFRRPRLFNEAALTEPPPLSKAR